MEKISPKHSPGDLYFSHKNTLEFVISPNCPHGDLQFLKIKIRHFDLLANLNSCAILLYYI